jgi:hypothetical protein
MGVMVRRANSFILIFRNENSVQTRLSRDAFRMMTSRCDDRQNLSEQGRADARSMEA